MTSTKSCLIFRSIFSNTTRTTIWWRQVSSGGGCGFIHFFKIILLNQQRFKYFRNKMLGGFDAELTDLIQQFETKGYLDKTLLIVMSDHGSRLSQYGFYTEPGRIERSMPFMSIRLPKQLLNTQFHSNLKSNKNKLISMFDVYKV